MKMNKYLLILALLFFGWTAIAHDEAGQCQIEDWRWSHTLNYLTIEGVTACDSGKIIMRIYEGSGDGAQFIGNDIAYIEGHAFTIIKMIDSEIALGEISIRYSIKKD